ncbi:sialoadhesin-like isoform X3 [Hippoglossus hippoglossus]|uniref:sialoadhesin-like isoform X3 n=1 Tax=Hippoglossus hippoglossus TaxID=8267 RepID=UPI00148BC66C|nr:sialoadhesin-like isoform X3 [Hippoglossus hippoglossus]
MGLREAASCFVIFLLSVSVVQGANGWGVRCTPTQICAVKGSKVQIHCSYWHPSRIDDLDVAVEQTYWFTKGQDSEPVDLRAASEYTGRVQYHCGNKACTLTITDLRESDSDVYQFRFITNQPTGRFTGSPGVSLSVTGVQVISSSWSRVECQTSCPRTPSPSYIWYKNGQKTLGEKYYDAYFYSTDSISCAVRGHEDFPSAPVYAPKVPLVQLSQPGDILKGSSVSLTCSSDANPPPAYAWYKKNQTLLNRAAQLVFSSIPLSDSGEYYCTAENALGKTASKRVLINVKYAPQSSSVSVSPSGEIMEGSSVTLTCSSDANPAANYTWYKENRTLLQGPEGVYRLSSISSGDSGVYSCKSENQYGRINSTSLHLDVQYAPKPPSVSVSPSGEIMEGSSVTLTCSSDANPAANYTWYKRSGDKQVQPLSEETQFVLSSIRSSDSGEYYCTAENELGRSSANISITVTYAPKPPSVSASPSAEIMEGSSVTLTCSSDANPAANYTWYKRSGDKKVPPLSEETQFVLSSIRSSDSGEYYCTAENELGRSSANISITVTFSPGSLRSALIGSAAAVFLAVTLLSVFLLIRKKRNSQQSADPGDRLDHSEQRLPNQSEENCDLHYASVHFMKRQTDPVSSNVGSAEPSKHKEAEEVVYASVNFNRSAPRTRGQDTGEDPAALYSTVKKPPAV